MRQIDSKIKLNQSRQKGFSIVELLIAGTLGLLLLGGVIQLFLGSNKNYTLQGELAGVQEDGRFALSFLESQIQSSSWTEDFLEVQPAIDFTNSSDGVSDVITVTRKVTPDGVTNIDCNGAVVIGGVIQNRFYVEDESLMCLGNGGGNAQPFLENVERFQVLYGVETDSQCPDGVVNQYMTRSTLMGSGLVAVYRERVMAVRVALVLKSGSEVLPEDKSENLQLLDELYVTPSDRFARRVFKQTIYMPNAAFASTGSPDAMITCMQSNI